MSAELLERIAALDRENTRLRGFESLYRALMDAVNAAFTEIDEAVRREPPRSHFRRGLDGAASIMQRRCAAVLSAPASDNSPFRKPPVTP